jgi:hypothetical protein
LTSPGTTPEPVSVARNSDPTEQRNPVAHALFHYHDNLRGYFVELVVLRALLLGRAPEGERGARGIAVETVVADRSQLAASRCRFAAFACSAAMQVIIS